MDLELVVDMGLDPMEDQCVSMLGLAVGLEVIDRGPIYPNSPRVIEVQKLAHCELGTIISNNMIGDPKPVNVVLDELGRLL